MSCRGSRMLSIASRIGQWTSTLPRPAEKQTNRQAGAFRSPCLGDSFLKTRDQRLLPDRVRGSAERQGCHPIEDLGRGHQIQFVWRQPMNRQLLFVLSLLLFPTACLAQTTPNDSKTLQSLLLEVRQLRQDLQTTTIAGQRAQILIHRVQGQEAAVARASQRLDEFREKLARIQDERKHVAADVKRQEDFISNTQNPAAERKDVEGMLSQSKTRVESLENQEQQLQTREIEA